MFLWIFFKVWILFVLFVWNYIFLNLFLLIFIFVVYFFVCWICCWLFVLLDLKYVCCRILFGRNLVSSWEFYMRFGWKGVLFFCNGLEVLGDGMWDMFVMLGVWEIRFVVRVLYVRKSFLCDDRIIWFNWVV